MPWRRAPNPIESVGAPIARQHVRFYLNEPVGPLVRTLLENRSYRTRTASNYRMRGRSDEDHAALCWREQFVLVG